MDVNEIQSVKSVNVAKTIAQYSQKPASKLSADTVNTSRSESVSVEISDRTEKPERTNRSREQANKVISALNVISGVTEEIDKIVTSLSGLAEQATSKDLPSARRDILEQEAQQLLTAIDKRSQIKLDSGIKPLQGDPIQVKLEDELGKALEVILPETSRGKLGLGQISVSKVDTILATRRSIQEARSRLEDLRGALSEGKSSVQEVLNRADIASQNREASETQIRDVDAALKLTSGIRSILSENPQEALQASAIESDSVRILTGE